MKPYYNEGNQIIYHGDCREILPQLGIFDLCLTDPPYGVRLQYDKWADTRENLLKLIRTAFPAIRQSGVVVLLTPGVSNQYDYPRPDWTLCWKIPGGAFCGPWGFNCWQPILAYGKDPYLRDGLGGREDTITSNANAGNVNGHPCPKPVQVWKWLLQRGASRQTDTVLDPFLGSGTTLFVAKQLGHKAVGIEISERYCELSAKRLSQEVMDFR